jgi:hypothetical protein
VEEEEEVVARGNRGDVQCRHDEEEDEASADATRRRRPVLMR